MKLYVWNFDQKFVWKFETKVSKTGKVFWNGKLDSNLRFQVWLKPCLNFFLLIQTFTLKFDSNYVRNFHSNFIQNFCSNIVQNFISKFDWNFCSNFFQHFYSKFGSNFIHNFFFQTSFTTIVELFDLRKGKSSVGTWKGKLGRQEWEGPLVNHRHRLQNGISWPIQGKGGPSRKGKMDLSFSCRASLWLGLLARAN